MKKTEKIDLSVLTTEKKIRFLEKAVESYNNFWEIVEELSDDEFNEIIRHTKESDPKNNIPVLAFLHPPVFAENLIKARKLFMASKIN